MNWSLDEGTRRFDAAPWEAVGRPFDGHGGHSDPKGMHAAIMRQAPSYGVHPSRATAEVKSGLTRRGVIYEYIRRHPGAHVRGISNDLRLATGDLQYHLLWLEKHGFVKSRKSGFYRHVYPTMVFHDSQEVLLGVLSQETPREILLCLLREAGMGQRDLAKTLGYSQPTISWHMDRLVQLGVVGRGRGSKGLVYDITADREDVLRFVKEYHRDAWRRWAGRLSQIVVSPVAERPDKRGSYQRAGLIPPEVVELIGKR